MYYPPSPMHPFSSGHCRNSNNWDFEGTPTIPSKSQKSYHLLAILKEGHNSNGNNNNDNKNTVSATQPHSNTSDI